MKQLIIYNMTAIFRDTWIQRMLWHTLLALALFSIMAQFAKKYLSADPTLAFAFTAFAAFLLGIVHDRALFHYHRWLNPGFFLNGFCMSFCVNALSALAFSINYVSPETISYLEIHLGALLTFLIPFTINHGIRERGKIPVETIPGKKIDDLYEARALMSFEPSGDRYLRLKFFRDDFGYLPRFILVPVNEETDYHSVAEALTAAILFNNENKLPYKPICIESLTKTGVIRFTFFFEIRLYFFFRKYIQPSTPLAKLCFKRINLRDEHGHKMEIHCATLFISRKISINNELQPQFSA